MKITELKTEQIERIIRIDCDMCGGIIDRREGHKIEHATVIHDKAVGSTDGGSGKRLELDFCSNCFGRIYDALKGMGLNAEYKNYEW